MPVEQPRFRLKPPEQLKEQIDAVSARIGHPIVPASLGDQAITTEAKELEKRFPIHMDVHAGELRSLRREVHAGDVSAQEQVVFPSDEERTQAAFREQMIGRWQSLSPLVANLSRHVEAHQQREIPGVVFKPRQMSMFEKIRDRIEDGDMEGTIQAPTGWGKTVMFNQLAVAANVPTIILVPTQDLVEQTYKRFQQYTPQISIGRVYEDKKEYGKQVTVTTYASFLVGDESRLINPDGVGLVIFDEVHRAISERRVRKVEELEQFRNAVFVGLSATPIEITDPRFVNTRVAQMTKKIWDVVPEREAIEEGYLSSFHSVIATVSVNLSNVRVTADGEYNEEDLDKAINTETQNQAAVEFFLAKREEDRLEREQLEKKPLPFTTAWFSASVAQAQEHAKLLQERGIRAAAVWGTSNSRLKAEHLKIMEQWEKGEIEVVCSNMKLVEGMDVKNVRVIWNVAPTAIPWIEKQRTGRGLRIDDENNPDKDTLVVDFVYLNSNRRSQQVIYPQLIGVARLTRLDISTQPSYPKGPPAGQIAVSIDGIEILTSEEEIMKITNRIMQDSEELSAVDPETEFVVSIQNYTPFFIGGYRSLSPLVEEVMQELKEENPRLILDRTINGQPVIAVNKELFVQRMLRKGALLKINIPPQIKLDEEFPISVAPILRTFKGDYKKNRILANEIVEDMRKQSPDMVFRRRAHNADVDAVNRKLFIQKMKEKGVSLRDEDEPNEEQNDKNNDDEFVVIVKNLEETFIGSYKAYRNLVAEVIDEMRNEKPLSIRQERHASNDVIVVNRNIFIGKMLERGLRLRDKSTEQSEESIVLTNKFLESLFRGGHNRIRPLMIEVFEQLNTEYPNATSQDVLFGAPVQRIARGAYSRFIELMQERGVQLK